MASIFCILDLFVAYIYIAVYLRSVANSSYLYYVVIETNFIVVYLVIIML